MAPARAVRAWTAIGLLVPYLTGCFHHVPVSPAALPVGSEVAVSLTDRGRVELAERVGPGVQRITGHVTGSTDTELVLAVATVQYADLRTPVRWAGERVAIDRELISDVRERRLHRTRTAITAGLLVAGVILATFVVISGFGVDDGPDDQVPNGNGEQQ